MNLSFLKPFVPDALLKARKRYQKSQQQKKMREEIERRKKAKALSLEDFRSMVKQLGVKEGETLMVHSGIGTFNPVEGGAKAMLEVLLQTVGPQGNLIFPAFPDWGKTLRARTPFDAVQTASCMGTLAELFRSKAGVRRSLHPTHSVCAWGPKAEWLTQGHEASAYAFGRQSPFYKAGLLDAKILTIGLNLNSVTYFHVYEDLLIPHLWLPVYDPEPVVFQIRPAEGAPFSYSGYFHSDYWQKRDCERLRQPLLQRGAMKSIRTDYAEMFLLDSQGFILTCLAELLNRGSIYGPISISSKQRQIVETLMADLRHEFEPQEHS